MTTETITWTPASEPPDADTAVLIELDPAGDYSEPVFLGFHDGEAWHDVMGDSVQVIAWANIPKGTRG